MTFNAVDVGKKIARTSEIKKIQFGIGSRLFFAFGAVSSLLVLSAGVAIVSYDRVGLGVHFVANDSIPAIRSSLELANGGVATSGRAPALLAAANVASAREVRGQLDLKVRELEAMASAIKSSKSDDLRKIIGDMGRSLVSLANSVEARLTADEKLNSGLSGMRSAHQALFEKLGPVVDEANFNLTIGMRTASEGPTQEAIASQLNALSDTELPILAAMLEAKSEANLVVGLLSEAAYARDASALVQIKDRFVAAIDRLTKAVQSAPSASSGELVAAARALSAFGQAGGIFDQRLKSINSAAEGEAAQRATEALAQRLASIVDEVVDEAKVGSQNAVAEVSSSIERAQILLASLVGLGFLLSISVAWLYVGRRVVRRVVALERGMMQVADGDLSTSLPASGGSDELAGMARALLTLRDRLVEAKEIDAEAAADRAVNEAKRALREKETEGFSLSISALMETLRASSIGMKRAAEDVSTAVSSTQTNAANTAEASSKAAADLAAVAAAGEELTTSQYEIARQVAYAAKAALDAVSRVDETADKVDGLSSSAGKIQEVVRLISDIAGKTNLLALNATIEAARAGEAGKGFAVVASEVKALAAQTARATEEITQQVSGIQGATGDAVASVTDVKGAIERLSEIATTIAAAVEEQGVATREIVSNVGMVSGAIQETTVAMDTVLRDATGAGESGESVKAASGEVSRVSTTLDNEVERFLTAVRQ
jgi:methyl-accepting chemotaxis protein